MHISEDDKRAERESSGLLPIVMGAILALGMLVYMAPDQRVDFEKTGLGIGTEESFGTGDGAKFHCNDIENGDPCIAAAKENSHMRQVLWLGASQLHSINYKQSGDRTAVALLHEQLLPRNIFLTSFSIANGNFQELYVLFEHLRNTMGVGVLVIGAVYDDMRESGIRETVADGVAMPKTKLALEKTPAGRDVLERYSGAQKGNSDVTKSDLSAQQQAESYLNETLSNAANVWAARADFRGQLVVGLDSMRRWMLITRNKLLGIDSTKWTVRIDKSQYATNRAALEAILQSAKRENIPVLLYTAPRPIDTYFPYDLAEYEAFKRDVAELSSSYGVPLVNLEDAAVGDVWGAIDNGVGEIITDIFHFKASGHKQLAAGVIEALNPMLDGEANR